MKSETLVMVIFAIIGAVFAIYKYIRILIDKRGTEVAKATIVSIKEILMTTDNTQGERLKSGVYAKVSYNARGKKITSKTLIKLKENKKIGDTVEIRYFKERPEDMYQDTMFVPLVSAGAAILVAILALVFQFTL